MNEDKQITNENDLIDNPRILRSSFRSIPPKKTKKRLFSQSIHNNDGNYDSSDNEDIFITGNINDDNNDVMLSSSSSPSSSSSLRRLLQSFVWIKK